MKCEGERSIVTGGEKMDIEGIIKRAVRAAYEAGRTQREQDSREVYRAMERRLYAYPDIKDRLADDLYGCKGHSRDITRFTRSGRIPEAEKEAALDLAAKAARARDEAEIKEIESALAVIQSDAYYETVCMRYFDNSPDADIAEYCACDERTVRRNRSRLVRRLAVRLYGAGAL
jgi:hypothetical protein